MNSNMYEEEAKIRMNSNIPRCYPNDNILFFLFYIYFVNVVCVCYGRTEYGRMSTSKMTKRCSVERRCFVAVCALNLFYKTSNYVKLYMYMNK